MKMIIGRYFVGPLKEMSAFRLLTATNNCNQSVMTPNSSFEL